MTDKAIKQLISTRELKSKITHLYEALQNYYQIADEVNIEKLRGLEQALDKSIGITILAAGDLEDRLQEDARQRLQASGIAHQMGYGGSYE